MRRVNWSTLKHMGRSPAHYQHALKVPSEDTAAKKVGRCTHLAALEPELFLREVAVWDGGVRRGKLWDAFEAANPGKELLTLAEHERCVAIQRAVRSHPVAARYLEGGSAEATI